MKPIEVWGQQATSWTRASMRWLDRWRDHTDVRLDAVAVAALRRWLTSVALAAVAVCLAAAALHVILQVALRSGAGLGWFAVAALAAVAAVLLVIVVRDTVLSFAAHQGRRAHMLGFLTAAATLLASVQACAAATVAITGRGVGLWQAEQLYAWHLADSVPLLAIPRRLEWSQPATGDHAILAVFTVALIVPLVRMLVAIYHLTGGEAVPPSVRAQWRRWWSISVLPQVRLPRSGIAIPLVVAVGFVWGGLGRGTPIGEWIGAASGFVAASAVAAAMLGAILLAGLLSIVMGALKLLWGPISDGPWMQLVLAAALVWVDTPVRRTLLPSLGGLAAPWKFLVMLGLWAVVTILLLPVWVDPHLPESLLAVGLLLAFAVAGAPGSGRLAAALDWAPGGFAAGPALATALACLTGAYLAYLVSRAPARAANARRLHDAGSPDLRQELGGFACVGIQIITAAAAALMLLYGLGMTATASPVDASRSLLAVAWNVVDSLPGPDIPAITGWRPAADFTGPWAGAVVIITVLTLIVVVVFPMIRATLRWAKLKAGRVAPERPLAEMPAALLANLAFVRAFLLEYSARSDLATTEDTSPSADEQQQILMKVHEAEGHLAAAEFDRGKLADLLGEDSPVYWAADQAVSEAVDAYRTVVRAELSRNSLQWSMWPAQGTSVAAAIAAIDAYAAAADRWQMGADVVAELEARLHELEAREGGVHLRERDAWTREHGVEMRERGVSAREQVLTVRESDALTRERDVEVRDRAIDTRERAVTMREREVNEREQTIGSRELSVGAREQNADVREREVGTREQDISTREQSIGTRERAAAVRDREVDSREHWVQAREQNADIREQSVIIRERNAAAREHELDAREVQARLEAQEVQVVETVVFEPIIALPGPTPLEA